MVNLLGQRMLIINSSKIAVDMLGSLSPRYLTRVANRRIFG